MNKAKKIAIGVANFRELRELDAYYVDKTLYIKDILDNISKVLLITRPRRFGKTLNMSMLNYYLNITKDSKDIFSGLKIMKEDKKYLDRMNSTPVISLTLTELKQPTYEDMLMQLKTVLMELYVDYKFLLKSDNLEIEEKEYINKMAGGNNTEIDMKNSLKNLSKFVYKCYEKKPYLLVDEYDAPLQNSYVKGYYDKAMEFFKGFFESSFKINENVEKVIITGVSRIAKESIFSGVNNFEVCTISDNEFTDDFGITETEMQDVLKDYNIEDKKDEIATWYDGYIIGDSTHIYNPWSIMNYLKRFELKAYWANTSSNDIIEMVARKSIEIKPMLEDLLNDIAILVRINDETILSGVENNEENIWGLMLQTGYIKITEKLEGKLAKVKIVNYEVKQIFEDFILRWFSGKIVDLTVNKMLRYLTSGNIEEFQKQFQKLVTTTFSYYDVGEDTAENFYHAFVLGLLVNLKDTYSIRSNRESGIGRYDIMLEPKENKSDKAIIMEFKVYEKDDEKTLEKTLENALKQIETRKYETELNDKGFRNVMKVAFAFKGKDVKIKVV